jgi:hypothetical protein
MAKETVEKSSGGSNTQPSSSKKRSLRLGRQFRKNLRLVVVIVAVALIAWLAYGYIHTKNELNRAKNPEEAGKTEIEQIQNRINKVVSLPNETPTLATVSNASKLRSQTFFKDTQNGDKVLIYNKAGTAILYRPSIKKIIEYAPVNTGNNQ